MVVSWSDTRKHITFTCPNGRKCQDSSLHDETFLKENLEMLFFFRQTTGSRPQTVEPDEGWLGELAADWLRVMADLERTMSSGSPRRLSGRTVSSAAGKHYSTQMDAR